MHGRKHLNVGKRIQPIVLRQPAAYQLNNKIGSGIRIVRAHEIKIRLPVHGIGQAGNLTIVDEMGVFNDVTAVPLTENEAELRDRNSA